MSYLPYCILTCREETLAQPPLGVGGLPVFVVAEAGLGVAVSPHPDIEPAPDIPRLVAFARVVEWFHHFRGVLPVRYGCFVQDCSRIRDILREHRDQYRELLNELEGVVEMGIRILPGTELVSGLPSAVSDTSGPGAAYLALRERRYAAEDQAARRLEGVAERLRVLLSGTYVRSRTEPPWTGGSAGWNSRISVHFLVGRGSVPSFCRAVRQVREILPGELLLSGPWPPYNFVDFSSGNASERAGRLTEQRAHV